VLQCRILPGSAAVSVRVPKLAYEIDSCKRRAIQEKKTMPFFALYVAKGKIIFRADVTHCWTHGTTQRAFFA